MAQIQLKRGPSSNITSLILVAGEPAVTEDTNKLYIGRSDGTKFLVNPDIPASPVTSVAGRTGAVVLTSTDVGLTNVNNTSDANKPVSTAQQTALNLKSNLVSPAFTGTPTAPTAATTVNNTQVATTAYVTTKETALKTLIDERELKTNKGIANGYAGLDASAKIPLSQLSDVLLGQMTHAGTVNATTAVATLTTAAQAKLGTASATITLTNNTVAITGYVANQVIFI